MRFLGALHRVLRIPARPVDRIPGRTLAGGQFGAPLPQLFNPLSRPRCPLPRLGNPCVSPCIHQLLILVARDMIRLRYFARNWKRCPMPLAIQRIHFAR